MALAEENDAVSKEGAKNGELVKISMRKIYTVLEMEYINDRKVCLDYLLWLSEAEGFILPNHDTDRILPSESQRNTTGFSVAITDSSAIDYDLAYESSVYSIPLPPLKKWDGAELISRPKIIKSILRSKFTFKAEALKDVSINRPSSAPAKGNKSSSASKVHSAPAECLQDLTSQDHQSASFHLAFTVMNYKNFAVPSQEGLDKTYDRFQKLISQLEIHGEVISQEDANLKLLRSLPSAWNNIVLIIRNKSDPDTLSMDDFYNNMKVYESEIKGQSSSSSNSHNLAFLSLDNPSNTNEIVNTTYSVFAASSKGQASTTSYADDVMFSFFSNQFNAS
nr:hypothetical protein [Tanacetum cinerariifolium]